MLRAQRLRGGRVTIGRGGPDSTLCSHFLYQRGNSLLFCAFFWQDRGGTLGRAPPVPDVPRGQCIVLLFPPSTTVGYVRELRKRRGYASATSPVARGVVRVLLLRRAQGRTKVGGGRRALDVLRRRPRRVRGPEARGYQARRRAHGKSSPPTSSAAPARTTWTRA